MWPVYRRGRSARRTPTVVLACNVTSWAGATWMGTVNHHDLVVESALNTHSVPQAVAVVAGMKLRGIVSNKAKSGVRRSWHSTGMDVFFPERLSSDVVNKPILHQTYYLLSLLFSVTMSIGRVINCAIVWLIVHII